MNAATMADRPPGDAAAGPARRGPGLPPCRGLRLLVSVRDVDEALAAAAGGADLIDLKEPSRGALGGLEPALAGDIVRALRAAGAHQPVSATIGDHAPDWSPETLVARIEATAAAGVDWVKVGLGGAGMSRPLAWLAALAGLEAPVVPVLIVDRGLDRELWAAACRRFPMLMLDTADKQGGSLFERLDAPTLRHAVETAHAHGAAVGLAGALRFAHLPALQALGPDYAGFRSAVCAGPREGRLDAGRVARLRALASAMAPAASPADPSKAAR